MNTAMKTSSPAMQRRVAAVPAAARPRNDGHRIAFNGARPQRVLRVRAQVQQPSQQQQQPGQPQPAAGAEDEQRWDAQVMEGKVRNLSGADIQQYMADGWVLLDVRPNSEASKARIEGAVEVPMFVEDESVSLSSVIKRMSAFGMGGWWLGGTHMEPNQKFMADVQARVPKDARLVVGCQKGLRSLAACEQLSLAGYETLAWVNGGFDSCRKGEVPTVGDVDIRFAGIGGLSEAIGWTEVQQEQNKGMGGVDGALKVVGIILAADLLLFAAEYVQAYLKGSL